MPENSPSERTYFRGQEHTGELVHRPQAFGLSAGVVESHDVHVLLPRFVELVEWVRRGRRAHVEVVNTHRFNAHSVRDDDRPADQVAAWRRDHDPLDCVRGRLDPAVLNEIESQIERRLETAQRAVDAMPLAASDIAPAG